MKNFDPIPILILSTLFMGVCLTMFVVTIAKEIIDFF
jgi:hypothetical protein